jgi:ribosomal protein L40E
MSSISPVQTVPLSEAQICLDCEAISDTRANACPACGSASLWRLEQWINKSTQQQEAVQHGE